MSESIFRTATKQAIREIVEEHGVSGRFGWIVTEESMDMLTSRVVDLFLTTIELRMRAYQTMGAATAVPQEGKEEPRHQPGHVGLPRTRYALSTKERTIKVR